MKELEKLAKIQIEMITPALEKKANCDIIIKIRDGCIVFCEQDDTKKKRIKFK